MRADLPPNEDIRLRALREYRILDTLPEVAYEEIAYLAATICGTPIAAVSLVDDDRQWFKAIVGLDTRQTPRRMSFCAHAILNPSDLLVVEDATRDPRFIDNDLVLDAPNIRFYAGAPLVTPEGLPLGTLCVISPEPRKLTEEQRRALTALGNQVIVQLELRRNLLALQSQALDLMEAREKAEEAVRAKTSFLSGMSHEIRTPMNGVIGVANLLAQTPLTTHQRLLVELIQKSGTSLMTLVEDLIHVTQAETEATQVRREIFSPQRMVEDVAALFGSEAESKGIVVRTEVSDLVPLSCRGDATRIRHALTHLLDLGIQRSSGRPLTISVREMARSSSMSNVRFAICGSWSQTAQSKFDEVDLVWCRRLVDQLNGRMGQDHTNVGTAAVWFEAPLSRQDPAVVLHLPVPSTEGHSLEGCRVLVAEDNAINTMVIRAMLERNGCIVRTVEDGRAAIEDLRHNEYDLVFMDLQMPDMNGLEATRALRRMTNAAAKVPIVALTASALDSDRRACNEAGMNDFVCKPIDENEVLNAVRRWTYPLSA